MLLREFTLNGAKAFGTPQHIKLGDISLLFGGNSSGKSTLMQSILLLQQSLERLNGTSEKVLEFRGSRADLGGFRTFVHGHDVSKSLDFRLTVTEVARLGRNTRFFPLRDDISISLKFELPNPQEGEAKLTEVSLSDALMRITFVDAGDGDLKIADRTSARAIVDRFFEVSSDNSTGRARQIPEANDADRNWLTGWLLRQKAGRTGWIPTWSPTTLFLRSGRPVGGSKGSPRNLMAETLIGWWWTDAQWLFISISTMLDRLVHVGPLRDMPKRVSLEAMNARGIGSRGENLTQHLARNPQLLDEVNRALTELEIPYVLDFARFQHDEIADAVGDLGVAVLKERDTGLTLSLADVGFGVSQVLPVVVHLLTSKGQLILVEQPEIHLHPRLQARMADIIINSVVERQNQVIVETHSEHLLLRIERRLRERLDHSVVSQLSVPELAVLYVTREADRSEIVALEVDEYGQVVSPWPDGFFDESFDDAIAGVR